MFTMKSTQMKAVQASMESYARCVVESVAKNEGFNASAALSKVGFPSVVLKSVSKSKNVLLPWCGEVNDSCCSGIRVNHGLYTQCTREAEGDYCSTCSKNGGPKYGSITTRSSDDFEHASKVVKYSKVMDKLGITRQEAEAAAEAAGVTISESEFEKVSGGRRGRPRKLVDTSSDSDGEPKKRGRPKKAKTVVSHSAGDDLIASLMANAANASSDSDSSVASSEEKAVAKAAKAEQQSVEKAAKLAAKLAAKAVEKAAKAEQQAVEKAAKLASKAAEKDVKDAAKEVLKLEIAAAKAAEKDVKDAAKEVLKLEIAAAKAAEKAVKDAVKAAEKAAKAEKQSAAKAAEKAVKLAEKEAAKAEKLAAKELLKLEAAAEEEAAKAEKLAAKELLKLEAAAEEVLKAEDAKLEVAAEVASDGESYEDEEEDEVEVEEFTWLDVDYILNPSTGEMYDKTVFEETGEGESVGTYSSGEVTFV